MLDRILTAIESSDKNTHIAVFVRVKTDKKYKKANFEHKFRKKKHGNSGQRKNEVVMGTCKPFKLADTRSRRLLLDTASLC